LIFLKYFFIFSGGMGHGPKTKQLDFGGNLDHNAPEYFEGFFDEIFLKG